MLSSRFTKLFLVALTINVLAGLSAYAQSSYELMCRNKAKEIAAETYKNCVTEQRQSQLQQIRADYKDKLSELKNHYDNELKKVSGKQIDQSVAPKAIAKNQNAKTMRSSGARNLPKKNVRTEVIDLTNPSTESSSLDESQTAASQNRMNSETENPQDVEVVELPAQE